MVPIDDTSVEQFVVVTLRDVNKRVLLLQVVRNSVALKLSDSRVRALRFCFGLWAE